MASFHRRSEMSISNQPTNSIYTAFITYFFTWISFCSIKYEREGKIIKVISYAKLLIPLFLTNVYTNSYKDK